MGATFECKWIGTVGNNGVTGFLRSVDNLGDGLDRQRYPFLERLKRRRRGMGEPPDRMGRLQLGALGRVNRLLLEHGVTWVGIRGRPGRRYLWVRGQFRRRQQGEFFRRWGRRNGELRRGPRRGKCS